MVKRTVAVLGILALTLAAGTSFAFCGPAWASWDSCAPCPPLFLPVDCPTPPIKTIVKTWAVKIEGPCPAPGPACGPVGCKRGFDPCAIVTAIASPLDWLFGGIDGVYGCLPDMGCNGPCGPCYGPLGGILAAVPMVIGEGGVFGSWW
jgi:hypothetical protein